MLAYVAAFGRHHVVHAQNLPAWIGWFHYLDWLHYAWASLMLNEFEGSDEAFLGNSTVRCSPAAPCLSCMLWHESESAGCHAHAAG